MRCAQSYDKWCWFQKWNLVIVIFFWSTALSLDNIQCDAVFDVHRKPEKASFVLRRQHVNFDN